jgi:hypothetical protein
MFLSCGGTAASGGGGGGTTIINNYYNNNYLNAPLNTINFSTYPFYSNHATVSGTVTQTYPYVRGTFTIYMRENSVFRSALFQNRVVAPTMTFRDELGVAVKTVTANTDLVQDYILFRSVDLVLADADISLFTWQTVPPYINADLSQVGEVIDFYPLFWENATTDGTTISATAAGNIIIRGILPFVPYNLAFTGTVWAYDEAGTLVYTGTVLNYPNPVRRLEISGTVTNLSYFCIWQEPQLFDTFANVETFLFSTDGTTITFRQPTFIKNIVGTVTAVNGVPIAAVNVNKLILAYSIAGSITALDCERVAHFEQNIGGFQTLNFSALGSGEINIETDYLHIYTADQLNTPAMVNAGNIIFSGDANALVPFADAGTILVDFKQPTYVREITFTAGSTGTVAINSKIYPIAASVFPRDFINADCMLAENFTINFTNAGSLAGLVISAQLPEFYERDSQNYITEDFGTRTVEFAATIFDTNVATELGTPNTAFAGPGTGLGGGPGNGQNDTYLGGATTDNIVFDRARWVKNILFINCRIGYKIDLYDAAAALVKTLYIGNFGQNSVHRTAINKKIKSITVTGSMAIAEIIYGTDPRFVVGIPDNSSLPASVGTATSGTISYSIEADAKSIVRATSNGLTAGAVSIVASAAATDEMVYLQWPAASPPEIYHAITKTGGTGALIYYVIRAV